MQVLDRQGSGVREHGRLLAVGAHPDSGELGTPRDLERTGVIAAGDEHAVGRDATREGLEGVEDFRESYSPAQWSEVRQRLAEAKFRSARVFLQIELSDQMKQYLGASTARAEVPSVILE